MDNEKNGLSLAQASTMLQLQDQLNSLINPDWIDAGASFLRAAFVESAEALEHYGWKWWKKQTIDLPQVQMELVDILHFYLSHVLVQHNGSIDAASQAVTTDLDRGNEETLDGKTYLLNDMDVPSLLELIGALAACRRLSFKVLEIAMNRCSLSWDNAFTQYVSKNVLNIFRQKNGYKEGTYIKIWRGEEDNVSLARLMSALEPKRPDFADLLYRGLTEQYALAAKEAAS